MSPVTRTPLVRLRYQHQKPPSFETLKTFLNNRIRTLEALEVASQSAPPNNYHALKSGKPASFKSHIANIDKPAVCLFCSRPQFLFQCHEFKKKTSHQRQVNIESKQIRLNCQNRNRVSALSSTKWCHEFSGKPHSILHGSTKLLSSTVHNATAMPCTFNGTVSFTIHITEPLSGSTSTTILSTALDCVTRQLDNNIRFTRWLNRGHKSPSLQKP